MTAPPPPSPPSPIAASDAKAETPASGPRCRLVPVLAVTLLASLGTGLFWHGLGFIAETVHGFSPVRNLLLFGAMGAAYVAGAFSAHRLISVLSSRISARGVLVTSLLAQVAACLPVAVSDAEWTIWVAAMVVTTASSITWPLVEAFLSAGRHGAEMRRAIAGFNFTWMPAVAAPMFVVGPWMDELGADTILLMAPAGLIAAGFALQFPVRPSRHDPELAAVATGAGYRSLLRTARVLLPLGYLLTSAMSPLLPYRFAGLDVAVEVATPATATWMIARIAVLGVMWRFPAWHGRWDVLLFGGIATAAGFAGVMLLPSLPLVLVAFAIFGAGLGVVYYAALYYGMTVGHAGVDAGGTHEGLIGVGYCLGPMIALIGVAGQDQRTAVGLLVVVALLAGIPAVRPWLDDRRRRAAGTDDAA